MKIRSVFVVFLLAVVLAPTSHAQASRYEFRYHNYAESTALLEDMVRQYPSLARLYSIGTSATGLREVWCIEIGNQATGDADTKPATYFDGNQHATEVAGGEV